MKPATPVTSHVRRAADSCRRVCSKGVTAAWRLMAFDPTVWENRLRNNLILDFGGDADARWIGPRDRIPIWPRHLGGFTLLEALG